MLLLARYRNEYKIRIIIKLEFLIEALVSSRLRNHCGIL